MAVTVKVEYELASQAGAKFIGGSIAMDGVYNTGAEVMDLSAYFSGSPKVFINAADGYMLEHNQGTAAAGIVVARYSAGNALNGESFIIPLVEVAQDTNLALINTTFIAMGTMKVNG